MKNKHFILDGVLYIEAFSEGKIRQILVDERDFDVVNIKGTWEVGHNGTNWYARYSIKHKHFYMHRLLMQPDTTQVVDHLNHNGLDNRRSNLRNTSHSHNAMNRRHTKTGEPFISTSGNGKSLYGVQIQSTIIGYAKKIEEAIHMRDLYLKEHNIGQVIKTTDGAKLLIKRNPIKLT